MIQKELCFLSLFWRSFIQLPLPPVLSETCGRTPCTNRDAWRSARVRQSELTVAFGRLHGGGLKRAPLAFWGAQTNAGPRFELNPAARMTS